MRRLTILALACTLVGGAATLASAQTAGATPNTVRLEKGAPRPPAKVADLAWLTGRWVGEGRRRTTSSPSAS